ncbi:hypothetical protein PSN13_02651 [Micromonospora saelicesensis]|uniref:Uncharacterized protein n=1 Tax=Micromonospora saelicesensis TaxID=285676 RepID=A0A328NM91_9ACTN|nr:hypothetical protein [Micromonospora saelicesensis]RAO34881.1 hypothetical protein PSN13_02651 [Micromonospora saelicesensis]
MDVDNEERRAGAPAAAAGRRGRWKRFFERAPGLQLMAVYWVPMTVLIGLPVRWLFDRQEPLVEAVLNGALNLVWIGPAMYFSRWSAGEQAARRDPEGYALRQALRTSTVPADEATRTALPRYLAEQRRATWAALLAILGICLGLILLAPARRRQRGLRGDLRRGRRRQCGRRRAHPHPYSPAGNTRIAWVGGSTARGDPAEHVRGGDQQCRSPGHARRGTRRWRPRSGETHCRRSVRVREDESPRPEERRWRPT